MKPNPRLSLIVSFLFASLLPSGAEEKPKVPKPAPVAVAKEDNPKSGPGEVDPFAAAFAREEESLKVPAARLKEVRAALRIRVETWEVGTREIVRVMDHLPDAAALATLREEWLTGKDGIKLLWCPALGLDAATRMTAEAIVEKIYPTEYVPPVLPKDVPGETKPGEKSTVEKIADAVVGHCLPSAFETRNTGRTIEAVAHPVSVEKSTWDVSLTLEDVELSATDSFGPEDLSIKMPQFTSFRTGGLLRLKEGEWRLVSVVDPPRGISPTASGKQFVTLVRIDRTSP